MKLAECYSHIGEMDKAVDYFEKASHAGARDIQGIRQVAEGFMEKGDFKRAISIYRKIIAMASEQTVKDEVHNSIVKAMRMYAKSLETSSNPAAEAAAWDDYLEFSPADREAILKAASCHKKAGHNEMAMKLEDRLFDLGGAPDDVIKELVSQAMEKGDEERILRYAGRALAVMNDSQRLDLTKAMARIYVRREKYDLAMETYNKVLEINEYDDEALLGLQETYSRKVALYDKAIKTWEELVAEAPDDAMALANLAFAYFNRGNHDKAIEAYKRAVKLDPDNVNLYFNLGNIYSQIKNWEKAVPMYRRCVELASSDRRYRIQLARTLNAMEDYTGAISQLQPIMATDGNDLKVLFEMCQSFKGLSDYENAIKYLQKSIELKPDSVKVLNMLGDIYATIGRLDRARDAWSRVLKLDPGNVYATRMTGSLS